ncbi:hypothetical protein NPX79_00615 [Spiroplasma endosymbiont of Anurida maritima]|uniref:PTS-dependent dihydroxyacetone kinase phosphotransferase subunit DhaM n=1 Tax=Spiroplasma endosymbiont of Anurida maritima TaxID=2967972 RepID=UPI0036D3B8FC
MTEIMLVSHSLNLAKAALKLAKEMNPNKSVVHICAGINDGIDFGTSTIEIKEKLSNILKNNDALIIYDLGSSLMNVKLAIKMLENKHNNLIKILKAPFLEGLLLSILYNNENITIEELKNKVELETKEHFK